MAERAVIKKVEQTKKGTTIVTANDKRLGNRNIGGANIIAAESPEFVATLESLALENGTSVAQERQKFYNSIAEW